MRAALREAEHGTFEGWLDADNKFGVTTRIGEISNLLQTK